MLSLYILRKELICQILQCVNLKNVKKENNVIELWQSQTGFRVIAILKMIAKVMIIEIEFPWLDWVVIYGEMEKYFSKHR